MLVIAVRAGKAHQRWGWLAACGILSIAAGIAAFVWPVIAAPAFVFLIARAIVAGVFETAFALATPDTQEHPWLATLAGIISVLFGFVMAATPRVGALVLTWVVGIYAIIYGAALLSYACRLPALRSEARHLGNVARRVAS